MIRATGVNLTNATKQDVFDYVVFALINQGQPSIDYQGSCAYRAPLPDGTQMACGIGHLVADDVYRPVIETKGISRLFQVDHNGLERGSIEIEERRNEGIEFIPLVADLVAWSESAPANYELLRDLQSAHDRGAAEVGASRFWLKQFRLRARKLAKDYGLSDSITNYREPTSAV